MGNMFSIGWKRIGDDLPVHDIDWYAANEFCKRLNEREIKAGNCRRIIATFYPLTLNGNMRVVRARRPL